MRKSTWTDGGRGRERSSPQRDSGSRAATPGRSKTSAHSLQSSWAYVRRVASYPASFMTTRVYSEICFRLEGAPPPRRENKTDIDRRAIPHTKLLTGILKSR